MNIDIFIIARLGSARLPSKHLLKINEKEAIKFLIERLYLCKKIRQIVVCTTKLPTDDKLVDFLKNENVIVFRGNEKDILKRILDAAKTFHTDVIIDVEGDKILTDPYFVDAIANEFETNSIDFVIGTNETGMFNEADHFIHGLIPAGVKVTSLIQICKNKKTSNSETGYKEIFLKNSYVKKKFYKFNSTIKNSENIRLTLDYKDDLKFLRLLVKRLDKNFSYLDLIKILKKDTSLQNISSHLTKQWKENYKKNRMSFS